MNSSIIGFAHKPSVAFYSIEDKQLNWIHSMDKDHAIFGQLSKVDTFDYYYINQILVIPDPIPVARVNWNKNIKINDLEIECAGNFLVFFHFDRYEKLVLANSLTLPEYTFLKHNLQQ